MDNYCKVYELDELYGFIERKSRSKTRENVYLMRKKVSASWDSSRINGTHSIQLVLSHGMITGKYGLHSSDFLRMSVRLCILPTSLKI